MAMMTVNGQRLQAHLEALADIARTPDGICRLSYSDSFWKSNAYVAQLMREAGMSVTTNPVGNVVGTYPGRSPTKITIQKLWLTALPIRDAPAATASLFPANPMVWDMTS